MIEWIMSNLATIIISAVLAGVVTLIVAKMVRDKKKGASSCGCSCSGCAMSGSCHQNIKAKQNAGK